MKIFVCYVASHQKVTSAKDFHNQEDEMTCSVETSQSLSSATLFIAQWSHEQSGHEDENGDYAWGHQCGLPLATAYMAAAIAECLICQQLRPNRPPYYDSILQDHSFSSHVES